jgi:hypothetical protein
VTFRNSGSRSSIQVRRNSSLGSAISFAVFNVHWKSLEKAQNKDRTNGHRLSLPVDPVKEKYHEQAILEDRGQFWLFSCGSSNVGVIWLLSPIHSFVSRNVPGGIMKIGSSGSSVMVSRKSLDFLMGKYHSNLAGNLSSECFCAVLSRTGLHQRRTES